MVKKYVKNELLIHFIPCNSFKLAEFSCYMIKNLIFKCSFLHPELCKPVHNFLRHLKTPFHIFGSYFLNEGNVFENFGFCKSLIQNFKVYGHP